MDPSAPSAVINVNTFTDKLNVTCATVTIAEVNALSKRSLREAICAANNTAAHDTINLPKGVYKLDIAGGIGDDDNEHGDLDIKEDLTIVGAKGSPEPDGTVIENGYGSAALDGDGDRIIHVLGDSDPDVKLEKVALRYADVSCSDPCDDDAAAIFFDGEGKLTILDSLIYKNYSTCTGDQCNGPVVAVGLFDEDSELLIQGSTIKLNTSECKSAECYSGELLYIEASGATIKDSTIEHNSISCEAYGCSAEEVCDTSENHSFTLENTTVISNTLECKGVACNVQELLDLNETNIVNFKDSRIKNNSIFADGDPDPSWGHSYANELIDAGHVHIGAYTNLDIMDNSITCKGKECSVEEILLLDYGDTRTLKDVTIEGNKQECSGDGGQDTDTDRACYVDNVLDLDHVIIVDIEDTTIQDNTQKCSGNALDNTEQGCVVEELISSEGDKNLNQVYKNLRVINNQIDCIGARCETSELIDIEDAKIDIVHSTIHGNSLKCKGSGCKHDDLIEFVSDVTTISYSTFSGNTGQCIDANCDQQIYGGINNEGLLNIFNSTISGNQVNGSGGAILNRNGKTVNLNNVTIFGNKADADGNGVGEGGGICNDDAMSTAMSPSSSGYVGICTGEEVDQNDPALVNMSNTILAGNLDPTSNPDCYGTIDSKGHNLIQNVSAGCNIIGDTSGNIVGKDPLLLPLADNGGPTWTHALAINSPAVDAGENITCEPDDQREFLRPFGSKCDIGAYERGPFIYQPIVFRD